MKYFAVMLALLAVVGIASGCEGSSTTQTQSQSINLEGVGNARELGGYVGYNGRAVKHGVILRTADLSHATSNDIQRLQDVYHLATVIDLRMNMEIAQAPDPEIPGVVNIHCGIMDEEATMKRIQETAPADKVELLINAVKSGVVNDKLYITFLSGDQGKEGYSRMFKELEALPEGKSLLFHCTQGKDRTGCAAMLILSALGVDEDTIMADYVLTNTFNAKLIESERKMLEERGYRGEELEAIMKAMDEVDPQYMINALEWMKENYSSVAGYITQKLGVSESQIDALREKFLAK
ncbi:MAG: tyrosine-protein phosphatase [Synergistaceae bacterium]|nr:tyrosine-protein phosphatase [Synergistaceae bacterium]